MNTFFTNRRRRARKILAVVVLVPVIIALLSAVVMLLWNAVVPYVLPATHPIGYWQALALLLLCRLLFGGFHGRAHPRWDSLSNEEREQIKHHFKSRWNNRTGRCGNDTGDQGGQA